MNSRQVQQEVRIILGTSFDGGAETAADVVVASGTTQPRNVELFRCWVVARLLLLLY